MAHGLADGLADQSWPIEEIPDTAKLYLRVHRNDINPDGSLKPGAFKNRPQDVPGSGMSTDWNKYASPLESRSRARNPSDNAIVSLGVASIRQIETQTVAHTPDVERRNRAHSEVFGEKNVEVRVKLLMRYKVEIGLANS